MTSSPKTASVQGSEEPGATRAGPSATPAPRRRFLKQGAALGMKCCVGSSMVLAAEQTLMPSNARAAANTVEVSEPAVVNELDPKASRRIHLVNAHTWDDINVVYFTQGIYIDENIARLNHLMRDRRANVSTSMDTNLYDQLFRLQKVLGTSEPVHVLSGYRTPETNARLRRRSSGVAKFSLHMEGRAADIYIPGIPATQLRDAALTLKAGGVGLYSKSNFVHVDTGPVRQWGS